MKCREGKGGGGVEGEVVVKGKEELEEYGKGGVRMCMNREGGGGWGEVRKENVGKGMGIVVEGYV